MTPEEHWNPFSNKWFILVMLFGILFWTSLFGIIYTSCAIIDPYRNQTLKLINKHRETPLQWDDNLELIALDHSKYMARTGDYGHVRKDGTTLADRFKLFGYSFRFADELIHRGHSDPRDPINGWMGERCHREKLTNEKFEFVGMADVVHFFGCILIGTASDIGFHLL